MKRLKLIFITCFLLLSSSVNAQFSLYSTMGFKVNDFYGYEFGSDFLYKNRYSFRFSHSMQTRKTIHQPDDYSAGLSSVVTTLLTFGLENGSIWDHREDYQVGFGYCIPFDEKEKFRFHPKITYNYVHLREAKSWVPQDTEDGWLPNYTYHHVDETYHGFSIHAAFEFPFTKAFGFFIDPNLTYFKGNFTGGGTIGVMLGYVNPIIE